MESKLQEILNLMTKVNAKLDQIDARVANIEGKMGLTSLQQQQSSISEAPQTGKKLIGKVPMLNEKEEAILMSFISSNDNDVKLTSLYHPKPGQDNVSKARAACGKKNPLMIIIETHEGCKFGSYMDVVWEVKKYDGQKCYDLETWELFNFSIDKNRMDKIESDEIASSQDSVTPWLEYLWLEDNFMTKDNVSASLKESTDQEDYSTFDTIIRSYNKGKNSFKVKDLYLYMVKT